MDKLKIITYITCGVCLVIQIILICVFWDMEQISDCATYFNYAYDCFQNGEFYPMHKHLYSAYIFAPGFINFLILQLKIFGTLKYNVIFNLLMSWGITIELFFIGRNLFSERTAWLSVICFSCLYSTWINIIPMATEIPFLLGVLSAICLACLHRLPFIILAGLSLALANWIRPLAIIFVPSILLIMYKYQYSWKHYTVLGVSTMICVAVIGSLTYNKLGHFTFQSSTSGYNLLLIANDKAVLNSMKTIYKEGHVTKWIQDKDIFHIDNSDAVTFFEKDSIWRIRATHWIKEHPSRYTQMYLYRIISLYYNDSGMSGWLQKNMDNTKEKHPATNLLKKIFKNIGYYLMVAIFLITIAKKKKDIFSFKGVLLPILLLGTGITCLFSTASRYHHPFLFVFVIWAAYGIDSFMKQREKINKRL